MDVDVLEVKPGDAKVLEKFPMGKIPGFVGADGFTLHECNAIAIYCEFPINCPEGRMEVCADRSVMSDNFNCSVIPD